MNRKHQRDTVFIEGVGSVIVRTIHAVGARLDVESQAEFCLLAAREAYKSVIENPPLVERRMTSADRVLAAWKAKSGEPPDTPEHESGERLTEIAQEAASIAFRCCLPKIANRRSIQVFIGCVVVGVVQGYVTGKEANVLLYGAQQALTAYPKRGSKARRK